MSIIFEVHSTVWTGDPVLELNSKSLTVWILSKNIISGSISSMAFNPSSRIDVETIQILSGSLEFILRALDLIWDADSSPDI